MGRAYNISMITAEYKETLDKVNQNAFSIFSSYLSNSKTFIETGCHFGGSLTHSINGGYEHLYSCDINKERVDHCLEKLSKQCKTLRIDNTDSLKFFRSLLPTINTDATFWLDAHDEGGGVPTFEEIYLIKTLFKDRDSTIIIDDIPLYFNNSVNDLIGKIKEINPNYNFRMEYIHPDRSNYILVASTKERSVMAKYTVNN
ncbi:MAG: hypothetical protein CMI60_23190 [Parvibaculum sp.]|nr:hypothetical protein [Parvibaculum sp.]